MAKDGTIKSSIEIVVPTFNEGDEVRQSVERLIQTLEKSCMSDYMITVIVDGPDKNTIDAANSLVRNNVRSRVLPMNMGKGFALLSGFRESDAELVAFIDGDLDINPEVVVDAYRVLTDHQSASIGCVYASKFHPSSRVQYPRSRKIFSVVFRLLILLLFRLRVQDTQCGMKMFRRRALDEYFVNAKQNGFLFDVEAMYFVKRAGWKFHPVPVEISYNYTSSINWITYCAILRDTLKLKLSTSKSNRPGIRRFNEI